MKMRHQYNLILLAVFAVLATAFFLLFTYKPQPTNGTVATEGTPAIGGSFTMTDQHGHPFTEQNLLGKYSLVFFGFTHCPDVCPDTLGRITAVLKKLPSEDRTQFQVVFVTVDPQRDTQQAMADYLKQFNPEYIGLTGTAKQLSAMAKKYLVYYAVNPDSDPEYYLMDHSAFIYLMDKDGKYVSHYSHKMQPDAILADINRQLHP